VINPLREEPPPASSFFTLRFCVPAIQQEAPHEEFVKITDRCASENISAFLHIFLASEKNKRILHFANLLHAQG
jgi:hypothetical protein